jgi:hypothetical protein
MFNIIENSKNLYIFTISSVLCGFFFILSLEVIKIFFSLNYTRYFFLNVFLVHLIYIFFYNKVLVQLQILLFLRNNFFRKYYRVIEKLYPFENTIQLFF